MAASSALPVKVRMYRQGLGDCFLISFGKKGSQRHVMIDCGTLGSTTTGVKMKDVVKHVSDSTGKHLDLLVATHEHKDHVSGFNSEKPAFDDIEVDHVWLAWTENAEDDDAKKIAKYKGDLLGAAKLAARALETDAFGAGAAHARAKELGGGIRELLGFSDESALGATLAKTINEAMGYVQKKAGAELEFRDPGQVIEPAWLPGVRVYVLGPPRDPKALANLGKHGSEELYELAARRGKDLVATAGFFAAAESHEAYYATVDADERAELERVRPFDSRHRIDAKGDAGKAAFTAYFGAEEGWRRIDHDWLTGAADLALQLDGQTNNTSLALAFELIEKGRVGKVLLFPADAQVGNWLSWHGETMKFEVKDKGGGTRTLTAKDLLAHTVLYKVGHHASHNATVREHGLEMMESPDLVALIPVDRAVAIKKTPRWEMPARGLYKRLLQKAGGRVLRSDIGWATPEKDFPRLFKKEEWEQFEAAQQAAEKKKRVAIDPMFIEWSLGG
jgi:hypothetical protein